MELNSQKMDGNSKTFHGRKPEKIGDDNHKMSTNNVKKETYSSTQTSNSIKNANPMLIKCDSLKQKIDNYFEGELFQIVNNINYKEENINSYFLDLEKEIFKAFGNFKAKIKEDFNNINNLSSSLKRRSSIMRKDLNIPNPKLNNDPEPKKTGVNLVKVIENNSGGVFFHPREIINDSILVTGGRDGVIKFWDIKSENTQFQLINQISTEIQWITCIEYEKKHSHIYASTYARYLFILAYNIEKNEITKLKTVKTELNLIYGFDLLIKEEMVLFACSGFTESPETVYIYKSEDRSDVYNTSYDTCYTSDNLYNIDYSLVQALSPLDKITSCEVQGKNISKSLKFCEKFNLLIIGLLNGIIEVYKINNSVYKDNSFSSSSSTTTSNNFLNFVYFINLATSDWIYQIQIITSKQNYPGKNYIFASNANSFYKISFTDTKYKIKLKKDFIGSIHDFCYVGEDMVNNEYRELVFIKIKTSMTLVYDINKGEVIDYLDESKNKGHYDHCLIGSKNERLIFSCRDHDIMIYKY